MYQEIPKQYPFRAEPDPPRIGHYREYPLPPPPGTSVDKRSADSTNREQQRLEMADCVTRVELHVSCRGLFDRDVTSKSDPLCAMYIQDAHGKWIEVSEVCFASKRPKRH